MPVAEERERGKQERREMIHAPEMLNASQAAAFLGACAEALRACHGMTGALCCRPPDPLARRERRTYPLRYVRSEQHSQRAGICPPGARAKVHRLFRDRP